MTELLKNKDPEILLKNLSGTSGLERIRILADLTVALREINPEKVIEFGKQGLELLQNNEDKKLESIILNELCWAYHCIGEYQTALDYGFRELSITSETGDESIKSTALNRIGAIHLKMARFDQALDISCRLLKFVKRPVTNLVLQQCSTISESYSREQTTPEKLWITTTGL